MYSRNMNFFPLLVMIAGMILLSPAVKMVMAADAEVEKLKAQLKSPDAKQRRQAAADLGKTNSREAVAPLLTVVQDPDVELRRTAVRALGLIKDQTAITMLLAALKDVDEAVREEAIVACVNLYVEKDAGFVVTRVAKKVYNTINPFTDPAGNDPTVIEPHIKVSPAVIDGIADRLTDTSLKIRLDAARALGVLKAAPAIPKMTDVMKIGDPNLKIALLRSLYKIKDTTVDEKLLPYLNDSDKQVRDETILTLGLFKSKKALPALQEFYDRRSDDKLRLKALEALSLIGDPSLLEMFKRNLHDPEAAYRQYSAEGLARIANLAVTEDVSKAYLTEKKPNVQFALSYALHQMGRKEYMEKLVVGLQERMHHNQVENYLVEMGNPAVPELLNYLDSPQAQIRERICYVLGMIGDPAASPKLRLLLKDSDANVASEASLAMRRIGAR